MSTAKNSLIEFILSLTFLDDYRAFNNLLQKYAASLIILLRDTETPIVGEGAALPMPNQQFYTVNPSNPGQPIPVGFGEGAANKMETVHFTIAHAVVLAIVIIFTWIGFISMRGTLPIVVPALISVGSICAAFSQQIAQAIKAFLDRNKKGETAEDLKHWISKSIAEMRETYTKKRFHIMQSRVTKDTSPNAKPGENEELFDLKKQSEEILAQDFISKIDWIDTECNDAAFKRKQFLLSLLKPAPQFQQPLGAQQ